MKHIKLWENFRNADITLKIGFRDRWRNYDLLYYNAWMDGEKIMDALTGPAWDGRSDEVGWLYVVAPTDNQEVAYVVSISFPLVYKGLGLSEKIYQKLANDLEKQIRNPKEEDVLSRFFNTTANSDRYWELRRDLPFFPDNQFQKDF
jgi:hypothetical protein